MKTIKAGSKIWTNENLNVTHFLNGDPIYHAKTNSEWKSANAGKMAAWCFFDNDPSTEEEFGRLYNWYAMIDKRGIAPEGFRLPSLEDWIELIETIAIIPEEGKSNKGFFGRILNTFEKKITGNMWTIDKMKYDFYICIYGYRFDDGFHFREVYGSVDKRCTCWSTTEINEKDAWCFDISQNIIHRKKDTKGHGYYIRCVKEDLTINQMSGIRDTL
jgi:uncharacterized protein (TIGR02145 family)